MKMRNPLGFLRMQGLTILSNDSLNHIRGGTQNTLPVTTSHNDNTIVVVDVIDS